MTIRLALASVLVALCGRALAQDLPQPITCLISPARVSAIGAGTSGIVARVAVTRGSSVAQGDLLVQLDDRMARSDLARAEVVLRNTQERLDRAEALSLRNVVAEQQLQALQAEQAIAATDVNRAQLEIERRRIRAPFAGTVAEVLIEVGELTGVDPLLRLIETDELRIEMAFAAAHYSRFRKGQTLRLRDQLQGRAITAEITAVDGVIDSSSNSFFVLARVRNTDGQTPAGVGCEAVEPLP